MTVALPEPGDEPGRAYCRLVPAPGGVAPAVRVIRLDIAGEAADDRAWVSIGTPVQAGGASLAPLSVLAANDGVACRGVELELEYDRASEPEPGTVMGRLMSSLAEGGMPDYRVDQPGYLIIVPDDFYDNVLPLAAWKQRKGFVVWVRKLSETGNTNTQIQDYIRTAYQTWVPAPSYVLLVGAISKVPAFHSSVPQHVSDNPYACVDGADFLADLFVGRLPAANASELDVMVAKTIGYESQPFVADTTWYRRALAVGTSYQEGGTPAITAIITKRVIREQLLAYGFTQVDTVFYPPTYSGRGPVDSAVNRGVSFINGRGWGNYDGWGYPQYLTNDVYGLANGWKLPVITSIYCGTGNYARNPCFGEAWLRAGTPGEPKGGVAFFGSSWTGTSTRWNNCMDFGIYHAILDNGVRTCGPAMYLGKLEQYENFPLAEDSFDLRVYFQVYNLMGDPALEMWTGVPRAIAVSHPATFPVGTSAFEVRVLDEQARPVAGALVGLDKAGEVQVAQRTDAAGWCRFAIACATADSMLVTVTGPNLRTYLGKATGTSQGAFVSHAGHLPASAAPGQAVSLVVTLKNFGSSQSAPAVTARLRSLDTLAAVTDSVRSYGDLAPGASNTPSGFGVRVAAGCTSATVLRFQLAIASGDSNWTAAFDLPVSGPTLVVRNYQVHDGNGWLDPGETAELSVKVANSGNAGAGNVQARLRSLDAALLVQDSVASYGTIAAGDSAQNTSDRFQVRAGPGIGVGRKFTLRLVLSGDGGFSQFCDFPVTVGQPVASSPLGPDRHGYYAYDDTDAGYAERPAYDWVEIDPGLGGPGMKLELVNDEAKVVPLPFDFRFYGRQFNSLSIGDNGYVGFDNRTYSDIYNWHIPSACGPDGLIAAFWDDFRADTLTSGGVFTHFDNVNHRFLVEWSRCRHVHGFRPPSVGEEQSFQLVLLDPQYHSTVSGDGPIVVQYQSAQNDDSLWGNSHNYATVGIMSPYHDDGLEYTFAGAYPAAAALVGPSRAIRFTTNPPDTFTAVEEPGPSDPARFVIGPNPVRTALAFHGPAGPVRIYDALGREVRELTISTKAVWDLCDNRGERVRAGVYFIERLSDMMQRKNAVVVLGD